MSKKKFISNPIQVIINEKIKKFFILWYSKYQSDLSYDEFRFIMWQYFNYGSIAVYKDKIADTLLFTPFATNLFGRYQQPLKVTLTPLYPDRALPQIPLNVNEDVVVSYILPTKQSLVSYIYDELIELANIECLYDVYIDKLKVPWFIVTTPENRERMNSLVKRIMDGNSTAYVDIDDVNALKNVINTTPYILDKIHTEWENCYNRILTLLGIDNFASRKKERELSEEINANNENIMLDDELFTDVFNLLSDNCQNVFGKTFTIEKKFDIFYEEKKEGNPDVDIETPDNE